MSVTGLALPSTVIVPHSGCDNQLRLFSDQSTKGHSKDKLQESKLIQAVHLHFQITNLISSYYKTVKKLQIYSTDPIY